MRRLAGLVENPELREPLSWRIKGTAVMASKAVGASRKSA
jgi:hypothetical protein